jgi:hypothetical protein
MARLRGRWPVRPSLADRCASELDMRRGPVKLASDTARPKNCHYLRLLPWFFLRQGSSFGLAAVRQEI